MRATFRLRSLLIGLFLLFAQPALPAEPALSARAPLPEDGGYMVSAAHELAAEAGREVLAEGGSAVDAAIAVQMVLNLVEPQSSGIGGGAFMLHWSAEDGTLEAYDGRETAPAYVEPDHFLDDNGKPLNFPEAVLSGKSVGVPGTVAMLKKAHEDHGRLPWARLFEPAIELAEQGFPVAPHLRKRMRFIAPGPLGQDTRAYFYGKDGKPLPVGHVIVNKAFADTLRRIAEHGAEGFYEGPVAEAIVKRVRTAPNHPGPMTLDDLAGYEAKKRKPVCRPYRAWRVCGFPPPTSGGVAVLQILALLERFDMASLKPGSVEAVHLISEASRLAYADRNLYLADTDYVEVPVEGLLDTDYLKKRSKRIDPARSMGKAKPGTPPGVGAKAPDTSPEFPGTSHASIVDADGNVVSITMTIEFAFGSQLMAAGFLLNNELTDFSFRPEKNGKKVANAPAAGKRPRSSMSPTIVFDGEGKPLFAIGSAGGSRIPLDVVQALIAVLDWDLPLDEALALPHHANKNGPTILEEDTPAASLKPRLEAMGHKIEIKDTISGLHGIVFKADGLSGAADPRRDGTARGGTRTAD